MNIRRFTLLQLILTLVLTGCAPIPHFHYHAPAIKGVVTINGDPAVNSKIYLGSATTKKSCDSEPVTAITNKNGEFDIGPIKEFRYIAIFYGDPYIMWELCAEHNGKIKQLLNFDAHFSPETLEIKCELTLEETTHIETVRGLSGLCEVNDS